MATGPAFKQHVVVEPFSNIEVYELLAGWLVRLVASNMCIIELFTILQIKQQVVRVLYDN